MRANVAAITGLAVLLALCSCGRRDENTDGNGPGNADGFGGRTDPPAAQDRGTAAPDNNAPSESARAGGQEPEA
jgi:hypothetical protein